MKIEYSKVEELLMQALRKMKTQNLIKFIKKTLEDRERNIATEGKTELPPPAVLTKLIVLIKKDLAAIERADPAAMEPLSEVPEEVSELITHLKDFSEDDWNKMMTLKEKLRQVRSQLAAESEEELSESLIQEELDKLEKQGKFNFKANKKWRSV